jgi:hypothetical protein
MKKNDLEVTAALEAGNPYNEMEILNSSLSKYFEGNSGSLSLKEMEASIMAALSIYFQGHIKF